MVCAVATGRKRDGCDFELALRIQPARHGHRCALRLAALERGGDCALDDCVTHQLEQADPGRIFREAEQLAKLRIHDQDAALVVDQGETIRQRSEDALEAVRSLRRGDLELALLFRELLQCESERVRPWIGGDEELPRRLALDDCVHELLELVPRFDPAPANRAPDQKQDDGCGEAEREEVHAPSRMR